MTVHHSKVSAIADVGDPTLVEPSDWNAPHVIDNGSIAVVKLDPSALPNGSPLVNISGAVGSTNGKWGVDAVDFQYLQLVSDLGNDAPAAGNILLLGGTLAGKDLPYYADSLGDTPLQTLFGKRSISTWIPSAGTATLTASGFSSATATGTITLRSFASTSLLTSCRRVAFVSAAGAGSVGGVRANQLQFWRGNAGALGGFFIVYRFGVSDAVIVTTGRMFVGLNTGGVPTDVDPDTLVNNIGVGCNSTDTNLQLYASGAAAQARVSLGAGFPVNGITNGDAYELILYCAPNSSSISYQVTRLSNGTVASGTVSAGANLMANTVGLAPQMWRSNGGTAAATGIDVLQAYAESTM